MDPINTKRAGHSLAALTQTVATSKMTHSPLTHEYTKLESRPLERRDVHDLFNRGRRDDGDAITRLTERLRAYAASRPPVAERLAVGSVAVAITADPELSSPISDRKDANAATTSQSASGSSTSASAGSTKTKPAAQEPAASQPAATQPAAQEPAASQPAATEPAASEPAATQPAAQEPAATEPAATEPAAQGPVASITADTLLGDKKTTKK